MGNVLEMFSMQGQYLTNIGVSVKLFPINAVLGFQYQQYYFFSRIVTYFQKLFDISYTLLKENDKIF